MALRKVSLSTAGLVLAGWAGTALSELLQDDEVALNADAECAGDDSECTLHALQLRAAKKNTLGTNARTTTECKRLDDPVNANCRDTVRWAAGGGKNDPHGPEWFKDMPTISGVGFKQGSEDDFQRLYFCSPPGGKSCGAPPCSCSKPPCDTCLAGEGGGGASGGGGSAAVSGRSGCAANPEGIECKPPKTPMGYKGMTWPTFTYSGAAKERHIFLIGDWGGMDGSLNPIEGRPRIIAYNWGAQNGPSVFPRTRWNKQHTELLCSHKEFVTCFNTRGQPPCPPGCGFVAGVDDQPQQLVAKAMQGRAALSDPEFLLNVGDNFYWGGIEKTCGTPMHEISFTAHHQFSQIFEGVYGGSLSGKPWISVLGNHDWGGRVFNNGWDQQIAYTWASNRWIMPAPYYKTRVEYPDQGFSIDLYMLDSNFVDAKEPSEDPEHNICGSKHNPPNADCSVADGPSSIDSCPQFFADLWAEQQVWVKQHMAKSDATWRFVVTHFPCGHAQGFYSQLHSGYGLDLLITGHRHDQEIWLPDDYAKNHMGGLTCIVTGGGGGITSEATPNPENTTDWYGEGEYGFYDLAISESSVVITSINWNGNETMTHTVHSRR